MHVLDPLSDYARWGLRRYRWTTIKNDVKILRRLRRLGVDLEDEEAVMEAIMNLKVSVGRKHIYALAYARFLRFLGRKPSLAYREFMRDLQRLRPRKLARIPKLETAKAVIAAIPRSQAKYLLWFILETGLRLGEALNLRWSQVDLQGKRLIIEESEKRSEGSIIPLSDNAIEILNHQADLGMNPKERVFKISERWMRRVLKKAKDKMRPILGDEVDLVNPKNLRHLYATQLYSKTRDLVYVQRMLRHRSILTTQRYVHMITQRKDYDVKVVSPQDSEIIKQLLEMGYEVALQTKNKIYLRRLRY